MGWKRPCQIFLMCVIGLLHIQAISGVTRKYFIAAKDVEWDYAETQKNLVNKDQQNYADMYLKRGTDRIGGKYMKTVYYQYTDDTFTTLIPKPDYLGILGPTIRGEVGDEIDVLYFNDAAGTYSIHAHGVFYLKEHEGALYLDGTSGRLKTDDIVEPGQKVRLIWHVTKQDSPGVNDPNCLPWVYHSHVNTPRDTSAGLIGTLVTCKKGVLNEQNERTDVDIDIPILMKIFEEGLSWHIEENIKKYCLDEAACETLAEEEEEEFSESNNMRSLNGLMYGHLRGLEVCVGQKVVFYVIGMGSESDVHSLFFQGQNLKYQHTRGDTVSVYTATFVAAEYTPTRAGTWVLSDMVDGMARAGMTTFYKTKYCPKKPGQAVNNQPEVVKEFFLSAEEVVWNYGPGGVDLFNKKDLTQDSSHSEFFFKKSEDRIGGEYKKAQFFGFTDNTYSKKIVRSNEEKYMGILGPVITVELGDTVKVTLKNTLPFNVSFLPHAFSFDFTKEIENGKVSPGNQHTYTFTVPETILDGADGDCLNFLYTSGATPTRDHAAGLMGPILICRKGYSQKKNKKKGLFVMVTMFDENESPLLDNSIRTYLPRNTAVDKEDGGFRESNIVFTLNGFAFGTMPLIKACLETTVTWYVMALGSDEDTHVISFDGNNFHIQGKNRNVYSLVAGSTAALHMNLDNPGTWMVQSLNNKARLGGAYGLYDVMKCGKTQPSLPLTGTRTFYIAAEEMDWDYAPEERGIFTGESLNDFRVDGSLFVRDDELFAGDVYHKALFREYLNSDFSIQKVRDRSSQHLDILGPVIKAEVGEMIQIHFKNKATRPFSMHAQGLKYSHTESGKRYGVNNPEVGPGETRSYSWYVPPRSGPGPKDPDCIPWFYFSALDEIKDVHAGLLGALVTCRPRTLDETGKRRDEHPEFFILMSIFDENMSWFFEDNVKKHAPGRIGTDYKVDEEFEESNKMHSINGRIFGNTQHIVMEFNKTVIWYMMDLGTKEDMHTFHLHGQTFMHKSNGHRDDVISLFPGMAERVDMLPVNPGKWLLHCHVLSHITEGMETTYTVLKRGEKLPSTDYITQGSRKTETTFFKLLLVTALGFVSLSVFRG